MLISVLIYRSFAATPNRSSQCTRKVSQFRICQPRRYELRIKLSAEHPSSITIETNNLVTEFKKWKCTFETQEKCQFIAKTGTSIDEFDKMIYLYCSRSNCVSVNSPHSCIASIKLYREISAGKLKAIVCSTHYGHDNDLAPSRSIEKATSLFDSLLPTPSIPCADDWLDEIDSNHADSPILFYKQYPETSGKCLIIMTKPQRDLFIKFCNNGMLYVTVSKLSSSSPVQLTVIYVLDDFYEMFPVCFMVDNKTNQPMLDLLFDQILNSIGPVTIRALATDDRKSIFELWCKVMGHNTQHIIANCHIDALWRQNLKIIDDEILQGEVYDKLYDFIENADGSYSKMRSLIEELRASDETSSFASYLEKNFLDNVSLWSTFFLKHTYGYRDPIDYETSSGKISTICDNSAKSIKLKVKSLLKLLDDLQTNRNCKIAESLTQIKNAHAASVRVYVAKNIVPIDKDVWKINDESESYRIEAEHCSFDECMLKCVDCEACVHNFRCVCDDYSDGKTCVHTHLVGTLRKIETEAHKNDENIEDCVEEAKTDAAAEDHELSSLKTDILTMLDKISKNLLASTDETMVEKLYNRLKDLQGNLEAMMNYGEHAQKVWLSNNCKPMRRKYEKKRAEVEVESPAVRNSVETPTSPAADRPTSAEKSVETENGDCGQKKRRVQEPDEKTQKVQVRTKTRKSK